MKNEHKQVELTLWNCFAADYETFECDLSMAWMIQLLYSHGYPTFMSCHDLDHGDLGPTIWLNFHGESSNSFFDDLLFADSNMEGGCALLRIISESRNILTFEEYATWHFDEYGALVFDNWVDACVDDKRQTRDYRDSIDNAVIDFRFWVLKEREQEFVWALTEFLDFVHDIIIGGDEELYD